jgi:hypothetical protein
MLLLLPEHGNCPTSETERRVGEREKKLSSMSSFVSTNEMPDASFANPLRNAGILHHILDYAGSGHWLFLALVIAEWQQAYLRVASLRTRVIDATRREHKVLLCPPQTTLARAVFASPSRLRLAY